MTRRSPASTLFALALVAGALLLTGCESDGGGDSNPFRPEGAESIRPQYVEEMRSTLAGQRTVAQELMDNTLLNNQMQQALGQARGAANAASGGFFEALTSWLR